MESFKRRKCVIVALSIILSILIGNKAYATEKFVKENSKEYQKWLSLSEEERENSISPLPYNIPLKKEKGINVINNAVKDVFIPAKYDTRDKGIVLEKKDQMQCGLCWAFSANSCAEIKLALDGQIYQFSERHLDYETAYYDGWDNSLKRQAGSGGNYLTALTYYTRGSGPILEEDMPFENNENKIDLSEVPKNLAVKKIDDAVIFPNIFKQKDGSGNIKYYNADGEEYTQDQVKQIRRQIKEQIIENGAVYAKIQSSGNDYNINNQEGNGDHMITIIGWDDNYSKYNFKNVPTQNGAYIILNSWGTEWGEQSIGYVSYEDFVVENSVAGIKKVSDVSYDNIYQYDLSEMWGMFSTRYVVNTFVAEDDEKLTEVMIGSYGNQICDIYLLREDEETIKIASNVEINPGYNNIKLSSEYNILKGEKFGIEAVQTGEGDPCIGGELEIENSFTNVVVNKGESYISFDGKEWYDCSQSSINMNACIKAFTKKDDKFISLSKVDGTVYEGKGGRLSFSIDTNYTQKGKKTDIKIFKGDTDVTNKFGISGGTIRGNGGFVKLVCPSNVEKGKYTVKVALAGYDTATTSFYILKEGEDPIEDVELKEIKVTTPPTKTVYTEGEVFDKTGMVVTAYYSDGSTKVITNYVISPSIALTTSDKTITIYYSEYPINTNTTINITVLKKDIPEGELYVGFNGYEEKKDILVTYLVNVQPNQTRTDVKANIVTNGAAIISKSVGNETNDDNTIVVTGDKLVISNDKETREYTIVVKGDVDGNGQANFSDMLKINKHRLNKVLLEKAFLEAGDIDGGGKVDFSDMLKINKYRLKKVSSL